MSVSEWYLGSHVHAVDLAVVASGVPSATSAVSSTAHTHNIVGPSNAPVGVTAVPVAAHTHELGTHIHSGVTIGASNSGSEVLPASSGPPTEASVNVGSNAHTHSLSQFTEAPIGGTSNRPTFDHTHNIDEPSTNTGEPI